MRYPIASIIIGERRREDYGDLSALASSLDSYGLLHPIVVDDAGQLVAGGRRVEAAKLLGWEVIEATRLGDLSETERRAIELEENVRRKDLTEFERSRNLTELAETAGEVARAEESGCSNFEQPEIRPQNRPQPDSLRSISKRIGVPPSAITQARQHVETADSYPFMRDWPQYRVLEARTHLASLDETERTQAVEMISEPGTPPDIAVQILGNLAHMPQAERLRIFTLYASTNDMDRSLAKTRSAGLPPRPDPAYLVWKRAEASLKEAIRATREPELREEGKAMLASAQSIIKRLEVLHEQRATG